MQKSSPICLCRLQELVDHARRELSSNTAQLQQLCTRSGAPPIEGSAGVYAGYNKALQDWDASMASRSAGKGQGQGRICA
jgi:hypothetical protein